MKFWLSVLFILFFSGVPQKEITPSKVIARCYGYSPCAACSDCSLCKYCNAGGTCGICAKVKTKSTKAPVVKQSTTSKQCQATTKKGSRCSRSSRTGGYCWQHG